MSLLNSASHKAFVENLKREIRAGKKPKQALAIAYAVQKHANRRKKHG